MRQSSLRPHALTMSRRSLLAAPLLMGLGVQAQAAWPRKPVTIVVPFAPGGAGNGSVRILSEIIGPLIGQPVVIDNRPGAGGITGTATVVASGDDHTLLMGSTSMTILPALHKDLSYDVLRDLQPIGMISSQPQALVVPADSRLLTLVDVVRQGRTGDLTCGNSGVGTLSHLSTELINSRLGTKIVAVPYKGDSVLLPDLVSGTIALAIVNLPVAMPLVKAGKLRIVALTSDQTVSSMPQVPLLKSLDSSFVAMGWAALFANLKVPRDGVARFEQALKQALADPAVREKFASLGVQPESSSANELATFLRSETTRWGEIVRASGIKLE